jgi:hypothetical protein
MDSPQYTIARIPAHASSVNPCQGKKGYPTGAGIATAVADVQKRVKDRTRPITCCARGRKPGPGSHTRPPTSAIAIDLPASALTGSHSVGLQVMDANGSWSIGLSAVYYE